MSGVKGRSGRKRGPLTMHLRYVLADTLTDQDWRNIFRALQETAVKGNPDSLRAADLLMRYSLGVAKPEPEPDPAYARILDSVGAKVHSETPESE